jgi:hypothetical protein
MEQITIELDCAPGCPRPGDLFPSVLAETGLEVDDFEIISKFFGNWIFELKNKDKQDLYLQVEDTIRNRITKLYNQGMIRYGSW